MRKRAAAALEQLFAAALKKNYRLCGVSAYRSYKRQDQIYRNNIKNKGELRTNQVSAMPGSSEHQTGLAIDVSCDSVDCTLEESFGRTPEGKWLKKNCHKYGFIIRYPHWRERVTGYTYEPWHIRYVGKNLAEYIYQKKLTLEEYYQQTTVENKVKSEPISDVDDIQATNEPEMTVAPTPTPAPTASASARPDAPEKKPTDEPKSTRGPKAEKSPSTKEPEDTKQPKASQVPDAEKENDGSPSAQEETKRPLETKQPVETKQPAETKQPVETKQPENEKEMPASSSGETGPEKTSEEEE